MVETKLLSTLHGEQTFLVINDGKEIGFLTKYKDTRDTKHPWKAYKGIGWQSEFLRSFYPEQGGKESAIQAIVDTLEKE